MTKIKMSSKSSKIQKQLGQVRHITAQQSYERSDLTQIRSKDHHSKDFDLISNQYLSIESDNYEAIFI